MKELHNNQRGFGVIQLLLIIVTVAVVGFGGWYVKNANDKKETTNNQENSANTEEQVDEKDPATLAYNGKTISFRYPKNWKLEPLQVASVDDAVKLQTADFKSEAIEGGFEKTTAGSYMVVYGLSTTETDVRKVKAAYVRGIVFQSKIEDGEQELTATKVGNYDGFEYPYDYEGEAGVAFEFVSQGVFVHARFYAAEANKKESPNYQDFQNTVLRSLGLLY